MSRRGFVLLYGLPVVAFRVLLRLLATGGVGLSLPLALAVSAVCIAVLVIGLAKRLHDCEHSGAWSLLLFVPIAGWVVLVLLCLEEGTPGPNAAGRAPLELTDSPW